MDKSLIKLFISIWTFILAIAVGVTVTFSWISITTSNVTDGLSLTVTNGEELEISVDGVNFYNKLPTEVIQKEINKLKFQDVTSNDGKVFYSGGPLEKNKATANVDYFSITLWFRTVAPEKEVFLVDNVSNLISFDDSISGTFVTSKGIQWRSGETFVNGIDSSKDIVNRNSIDYYYAKDAVRISFIEERDSNNQFDQRADEELSSFIFDPSDNPERGFGTTFGALDYFNKKRSLNITPPV